MNEVEPFIPPVGGRKAPIHWSLRRIVRTVMPSLRSTLFFAALAGALAACGGPQQVTHPDVEAPHLTHDEQIVAQYADTALSLAAFENAYAESVGGYEEAAADSLAAYEEFLTRYVNYHLKLRAARDAGMDTLPSVRQEFQGYRHELARPRLMERHVYEPLVRTLYERRQEEVDVSHIFVRVPPNAPPDDTLSAYRTLQSLADSLEAGVPFADLAYRHSEDPSAQQEGRRGYRGRLGYIRAGQIVESFEDRMYALDPGSTSDVFRSEYGYHLIKVHDRRPAQSPIRLSHILLRPNDNPSAARRRLDSVRTEIVKRGAGFSELAQLHSEDPQTAPHGGDLGEITSPESLPQPFRDAVAALDSIGDVSEVINSPSGFHLVKLTDRQERRSFEEAYDDLKEQISDQPRVDRQKAAFAREIRNEEETSVDTTRILDATGTASVDSLARPLLSVVDQSANPSPPVATLGDSTYTLEQLARHLMQIDGGAQMSIETLLDRFLDEKALWYAEGRLEQRDASFASMMKDYREGVLLFRYMQDSVWTVAAKDTAGLRTTYEQQREKYRHPERVRSVRLRAPADSLLRPYQQEYDETGSLKSIARRVSGDSLVALDTTYVTDRSPEPYEQILSVQDGTMIGPLRDEREVLLMVRDARLPVRPKSFEEAHSSVLQDYREEYEATLLRQLRERYDVKTFAERLRHAFDGAPSTPSTP